MPDITNEQRREIADAFKMLKETVHIAATQMSFAGLVERFNQAFNKMRSGIDDQNVAKGLFLEWVQRGIIEAKTLTISELTDVAGEFIEAAVLGAKLSQRRRLTTENIVLISSAVRAFKGGSAMQTQTTTGKKKPTGMTPSR